MKKYEIQNNLILLVDDEIDLDLQIDFSLPSLDENEKDIHEEDFSTYKLKYLLKEGVFHGEYNMLYPSGKLKQKCFYYEGKLHGPSLFYSEENKLLAESWFVLGSKQGQTLQYYLSGKLYAKIFYKDGLKEGVHKYFYEDGSLKTNMHFIKDKLHGEVKLFWPNKEVKRCLFFQNGLRHGWDRIYTEKGILIDEGKYETDKPKGLHRMWTDEGKLKEDIIYENDYTQWKRYNEKEEFIYEKVLSSDMSFEKEKENGVWVKRTL